MHKNDMLKVYRFITKVLSSLTVHIVGTNIVYSKYITSFSQVLNISMIQILCAYRLPIHKLFTNIRKGF